MRMTGMIIPKEALYTLRELRGEVELNYDNNILSTEIVETIVDNWMDTMAWRGFPTDEIVSEGKTLFKTLSWSSSYNSENVV